MYGTIARLQVKPGKLEEFKRMSDEEADLTIYPDLIFQHIYQSPSDENEVWLVVGFRSRDAYVENAGSPEQHQRYLTLRALLDADPEWHDGEIVQTFPK